MVENNRNDLYNISNQMVEIFIKDIFSKNNVDIQEVKERISEEQRESLKQSVLQLKEQVESFIYEKNAKKTITEETQDSDQTTTSPLREKFLKKRADE